MKPVVRVNLLNQLKESSEALHRIASKWWLSSHYTLYIWSIAYAS